MIARIWRGWTTHANADAYEAFLNTEVFPGILGRKIAGLRELQLLRLVRPGETEFVTIMWFDDLEAVRAFTGHDHEKAVVPQRARELLRRFEARSEHYEVRDIRKA
jgi:heme-degrading monooxygenase HmoA